MESLVFLIFAWSWQIALQKILRSVFSLFCFHNFRCQWSDFMANKVCYCPLYIRTDIGNDTFHLNKSIFIEYNNNFSKKGKIEFLNIRLPLTVGREASSYFPRILWIGMKLTERQVSTFISQSLLNNSIHVGPSVYPFSTWSFHFAS